MSCEGPVRGAPGTRENVFEGALPQNTAGAGPEHHFSADRAAARTGKPGLVGDGGL